MSYVSVRDFVDYDGKNVKLMEVKCPTPFFKLSFVRALSGKMINKVDDYDKMYAWLKSLTGDIPPKFIYGTYQEPLYENVVIETTLVEQVTLTYRISHKLFFHPIIRDLPSDNSIAVMIRWIVWKTILDTGVLGMLDFGIVRTIPMTMFRHLTQQRCDSAFIFSMDFILAHLDSISKMK